MEPTTNKIHPSDPAKGMIEEDIDDYGYELKESEINRTKDDSQKTRDSAGEKLEEEEEPESRDKKIRLFLEKFLF